MKKSAQVVMLPTKEKAKFGDLILTPTYPQKLLIFEHQKCTEVSQHLYILSDEEIKEGDWVYCLREGFEPVLKQKVNPIGVNNDKMFKKIIATTDSNLTIKTLLFVQGENKEIDVLLPQPSQSFIDKFVEEYNKGNVITEVMVEYEWNKTGRKIRKLDVFDHILKINPDNTINISMLKDSWSREEMLNLLESAWNGGALYGSSKPNSHYFDKWIEENL